MTRTLQSVLDEARSALYSAGLTDLDWTAADVVSARSTKSGIVVGELGWRAQRVRFACVDRSLAYRLEQTGMPWQAGLSGSFALRLVIHPRFGFQAEVYDVLTESLGRATSVARIAALCDVIRREGWAERQRTLADPSVPERLTVVTSRSSQGLHDFLSTIGEAYPVQVVEAMMGGDSAARSVASAIRRASPDSDLVIVLRGGGSASSMEWADDEHVVESVAMAPVPVWVAIGHLDDQHLIDIVAQKSFATPTQAAAELRRRIDLQVAVARESELLARQALAEKVAQASASRARKARKAALVAIAVALFLLSLLVVLLVSKQLR